MCIRDRCMHYGTLTTSLYVTQSEIHFGIALMQCESKHECNRVTWKHSSLTRQVVVKKKRWVLSFETWSSWLLDIYTARNDREFNCIPWASQDVETSCVIWKKRIVNGLCCWWLKVFYITAKHGFSLVLFYFSRKIKSDLRGQ